MDICGNAKGARMIVFVRRKAALSNDAFYYAINFNNANEMNKWLFINNEFIVINTSCARKILSIKDFLYLRNNL